MSWRDSHNSLKQPRRHCVTPPVPHLGRRPLVSSETCPLCGAPYYCMAELEDGKYLTYTGDGDWTVFVCGTGIKDGEVRQDYSCKDRQLAAYRACGWRPWAVCARRRRRGCARDGLVERTEAEWSGRRPTMHTDAAQTAEPRDPRFAEGEGARVSACWMRRHANGHRYAIMTPREDDPENDPGLRKIVRRRPPGCSVAHACDTWGGLATRNS